MSILRRQQPSIAAEIQGRTRNDFLQSISQGYAAVGFAVTEAEGNYLLGKSYED